MADYSGGLFYQTGPNYNHLKYLEQKSHTDRQAGQFELTVDRGIRRMIYSDRDLAKKNIEAARAIGEGIQQSIESSGMAVEGAIRESTDALQSTLSQGFETLSYDLNEVRLSVDELAAICDFGFSEVVLQLSSLNESVAKLIEISQSPNRTWALEQYGDALESFKRHHFPEAMESIDRAIFGFQGNPGYKLDHRFHILRGHIHLGSTRHFDAEVVDPIAANKDFLNAAKYAEHEGGSAFAEALRLAGWSFYCCNKVDEAITHLLKSEEVLDSDAMTQYLLSKVLFHRSRLSDAEWHFAQAIRLNPELALKAANDPDFLNHRDVVKRCIQELIDELRSDIRKWTSDLDMSRLDQQWRIGCKVMGRSDELEGQKLKDDAAAAESSELIALEELSLGFRDRVASIQDVLRYAEEKLETEISELSREHRPPPFPDFKYKEREMSYYEKRDGESVLLMLAVWIGGTFLAFGGGWLIALLWFMFLGPAAGMLAAKYPNFAKQSRRRSEAQAEYEQNKRQHELRQVTIAKERAARLDEVRSELQLLR